MSPSSPEPAPAEADARHALLSLVQNNPGLDYLESLLSQYNIFEAIGMVSQEIRHSAFLAFLLTPGQSHDLGDRFLKVVLQLAGEDVGNLLDADLSATHIEREWQNIDLLALNGKHKFALLIENKVYSGEHSNQLANYYEKVQHHYADYRIVCLYLTLDGQTPSHPAYRAVSYPAVAAAIEKIAVSGADNLSPEVQMTLIHYVKMLRRHILGDREVEHLCLQIYSQHKKAIDAIIKHIPSQQMRIQEALIRLIEKTPGLLLNSTNGVRWVSCCPDSWEVLIPKVEADRWSSTGRNLLFWFDNSPGKLLFMLQIRQGPLEERQHLFEIAQKHQPPLKPATTAVKDRYTDVYNRTVLSEERYENGSLEVLIEEIEEWWDAFCATDLPKIETIYVTELQAH